MFSSLLGYRTQLFYRSYPEKSNAQRPSPRIQNWCKLGGTHFRFSWYNGVIFCASRFAMGTLSAGKVYVPGRELVLVVSAASSFGQPLVRSSRGRLIFLGPNGPATPQLAQATQDPLMRSRVRSSCRLCLESGSWVSGVGQGLRDRWRRCPASIRAVARLAVSSAKTVVTDVTDEMPVRVVE